MATLVDAQFIEISISVFERIEGALPFDIYIKRNKDTYTKLFKKSDQIEGSRLDSYRVQKGIGFLFVHHDDYRKYLSYVDKVANKVFQNTSAVSSEDLMYVAKEMADLTMFEVLIQKNISEESVQFACQTVKGCLEVLSKDPTAFIKLLKMMNAHPYSLKHAIGTSLFSILLARADGMETEKALTQLGMGALLHDVGMSQISLDAETKTELSPSEWKEIKQHPELGKRLLDQINEVPGEVRVMVLQHHEQPNGHGYPNNLMGNNIYYPARIIAIADSFSALVSIRPYRHDAYHPLKALQLMHEDRGKFDAKLLKTFTSIFVQAQSDTAAAS